MWRRMSTPQWRCCDVAMWHTEASTGGVGGLMVLPLTQLPTQLRGRYTRQLFSYLFLELNQRAVNFVELQTPWNRSTKKFQPYPSNFGTGF